MAIWSLVYEEQDTSLINILGGLALGVAFTYALISWGTLSVWGKVFLKNGLEATYHENGQAKTLCALKNNRCDGWFMSTYPGSIYTYDYSYRAGNKRFHRRGEAHSCTFPESLGKIRNGKRDGYWMYWTKSREIDSERSGLYEEDIKVGDFDEGSFQPIVQDWNWAESPRKMAGTRFANFVNFADNLMDLDDTELSDVEVKSRGGEFLNSARCHAAQKRPW